MYGFTINADGNAVEQLRKIDAALKETGVNAKVEVGEIESHFSGMAEKVKETWGELKGIIAGGLIAGGIFSGFEFLKDSVAEFNEMAKALTRVDTVLKSTNFKAGFSGDDIRDQAKEMSEHIVAGKEQILDAQGMALSFTNVRGNIFKESMEDVADFAQFYKEDLTSAALQVDKAINDPAKGFRRLQRQGVAFTEEQEKQIKNYERQGQLALAQGVILKELHTEFGGQAAAFALTDEGKLAMDAKQWEDVKLEIGEVISKIKLSLLPVFADIRDLVKDAFESGPVQFFLNHIKDLLAIGLKIIPMWVIYKGIMLSTSLVTSVFAVKNGILTASLGGLTIMTDGASVAAEGFAAAWSSTGIGAIAAALGLVVEHLMSMNKQLDDAVEKKYKLSENTNFFKEQQQKYTSIKERMGLLNDPNFGLKEKQELYGDIQSYLHSTRLKLPELEHTGSRLTSSVSNTHLGLGAGIVAAASFGGKIPGITSFSNSLNSFVKTQDALTSFKSGMGQIGQSIPDLKEAIKTLSSTKGFKPPSGYSAAGNNGISGNAYSTAELAGAKGGLGEAKVINIHIDTVQKIEGVLPEGIKSNAESAIQILIRTINNMAYSQSATM